MGSAEDAVKEKLLWNVKKEVKSGYGTPGARVPVRKAQGTERSAPIPGRGRSLALGGGGVLDWFAVPAPLPDQGALLGPRG